MRYALCPMPYAQSEFFAIKSMPPLDFMIKNKYIFVIHACTWYFQLFYYYYVTNQLYFQNHKYYLASSSCIFIQSIVISHRPSIISMAMDDTIGIYSAYQRRVIQ